MKLDWAGLCAGALDQAREVTAWLGGHDGARNQGYEFSPRLFERMGEIKRQAETHRLDGTRTSAAALADAVADLVPELEGQASQISRMRGDTYKRASSILMHAAKILTSAQTNLTDKGPQDVTESASVILLSNLFQESDGRAINLFSLIDSRCDSGQALSDTLVVWLRRAGYLATERVPFPNKIEPDGSVSLVTPSMLFEAMLGGGFGENPDTATSTSGSSFSNTYDALVSLRENVLPAGPFREALILAHETLAKAGLGSKSIPPTIFGRSDWPVFLTPAAVTIFIEADRIRDSTIRSQSRIDARHFAAACLSAPAARHAFGEMGGGETDWQFLLAALETPTLANIEKRENYPAWKKVFEAARQLGTPVQERAPGALLPSYSRDKPWIGADGALLNDPLGVVADARAMADLIVLEQPGPPLAIGLFGDWGSGKSTFMEILEKAIEENTARAKAARGQMDVGRIDNRLPFVENVAHIRFNAWHYAEADLWASLAANIFRSLYDLSRKADRPAWLTPESFAALLRDLELADIETTTGEAELKTAESRVAERRVALDDANHKRNLWVRAKRGDMGAAFGLLDAPEDAEALDEKLESLGLQPVLGDAAALVESVRKAHTVVGRLGSAFRKAISWRGLAFLSVGAVATVLLGYGTSLLGLNLGSKFGLIAPLLAGGLPLVEGAWRAHTILSGLTNSADELESAAKSKVREASDALLEAERERADAETALRLAERRRASLEALSDAENPQAALEAFIEARVGDSGYHKNLGLISRLHDDFKGLSELLAASDRGGNGTSGPTHLQRIVLYIDDLDRCDDRTVLRVLEAVHLLLALPLFVVVVGVDARWLEGALARRYEKQLQAGNVRPEDYLEKIFQFPYWLRPMNLAKGGTFGDLVKSLLADSEAGMLDQIGLATKGWEQSDTATATVEGGDAVFDLNADQSGIDPEGIRHESIYAEVETPEEDHVEALREAVEITPAEVVAVEALGPLIAKSPRSAKRFMNLYRFEKARRMRLDAAAFMGTGKAAAEYPAVMLALAMDIGLPGRVVRAVECVFDIMNSSVVEVGEENQTERLGEFLHGLETSDLDQIFIRGDFAELGPRLPKGYWEKGTLTTPGEDRTWFGSVNRAIQMLREAGSGEPVPILEPRERLRARGDLPRASFRRPEN